jgi:RHS repeat-associated protein
VTERGFTGHEHLDDTYLIHMNGRVYDYRLGRFLSVDPIISNPASSQSINPYSYIGNNPFSGIDPTGYACDDFSTARCDTIWVNPPDAKPNIPKFIKMGDNGAVISTATLNMNAPASSLLGPGDTAAPPDGASRAPQGEADDARHDQVLLAQAIPPRGGGRGRGGGPRPAELPPESIEEIVAGANVRSAKERVEAAGASTAEMRPPGPRTEAEARYWERAAEAAEAAQAARTPQARSSRTPTDGYLQHTTTNDLVGAAREVRSGVPHGGQHVKEVGEAAIGLQRRVDQIMNGLSNPKLTFDRRIELQQELSKASKALDAAEQALQGNYPRHSQ